MNLKELKEQITRQITDIDDPDYLNAVKILLATKKNGGNGSEIAKTNRQKEQLKKKSKQDNSSDNGSENDDLMKWLDDRD